MTSWLEGLEGKTSPCFALETSPQLLILATRFSLHDSCSSKRPIPCVMEVGLALVAPVSEGASGDPVSKELPRIGVIPECCNGGLCVPTLEECVPSAVSQGGEAVPL